MSTQNAFKTMMKYVKENESKLISFEVDHFLDSEAIDSKIDSTFEKCYGLMRSIKSKESEIYQIYDSKKKRNEKLTFQFLKTFLKNLEFDANRFMIKFEDIETLGSIFPEILKLIENDCQQWLTKKEFSLPFSVYQIIESGLKTFLIKYFNGNCIIRNNTVYYNAENKEEIKN